MQSKPKWIAYLDRPEGRQRLVTVRANTEDEARQRADAILAAFVTWQQERQEWHEAGWPIAAVNP